MAITTYTELKDAVADWLNRSDLATQIPDFISFAEARFNRTMRVREMIERRRTTINLDYIGLPENFLEIYRIETAPEIAGNYNTALTYIGPDEAADLKATRISGLPRYYTIVDSAIQLVPGPSSDLTLTLAYYAKIPNLTSENETNWLLTKAPDLYLYTTLANASPYLNDDERIPVWAQLASSAFDELTLDSERASRSRTHLTARRRTF